MTTFVRAATIADAFLLAPQLREEDKMEIEAAGSRNPVASLIAGVRSPDGAWIGEGKTGPFCMFGTVPSPEPEVGLIWLLGTPAILENQVGFLRHSKRWLPRFHASYPVLTNHADARNTVHVEWLRWLGFSFINQRPSGRNGEVFLEFARLHV